MRQGVYLSKSDDGRQKAGRDWHHRKHAICRDSPPKSTVIQESDVASMFYKS
jgi:hypothetical protein